MHDLDETVRRMVDSGCSREELFQRLCSLSSEANTRAKRYGRARRSQKYRADEEWALYRRSGRILFYFQHGIRADKATEADHKIYDLIDTLGK